MTVKELIEKLSIYDEEQEVEIYAVPNGNYCPFMLDPKYIDIYQSNDVVCIEGNEIGDW